MSPKFKEHKNTMYYCPVCGFSLKTPVVHGISSCSNCNRLFDTCQFNKMLSASWLVRKKNITSEDALMNYGYTRDESELVLVSVYDNCCSHEDFIKILKEKGVSEKYC